MILLIVCTFVCVAVVSAYGLQLQALGVEGHESSAARRLPRYAWNLLLAAFAIRVLLGFVLMHYGWAERMAPDVSYYDWMGDYVSQWWTSAGHIDFGPFGGKGQERYVLVNALADYYFGRGPTVMLILTSLTGVMTAAYSWRIANRFGGPDAAHRVLMLVTFFPSLILWSSLNLRDPFMILAVTGVAWATIELKDGWSVRAALQLVGWCLVMGMFRDYLMLVIAAGAAVSFVGGGRHLLRDLIIGLVIGAGIALIVMKLGFGQERLANASLDRLHRTRMGFSWGARSGYFFGADTGTARGAASFLPIGVLYFLFGPFPWQARGFLQLLTIPEMLFWYWLTPKILRGLRFGFRNNIRVGWVLVSFSFALIILYGLVSGNLGTAYRHRAQVLPLLLVLAGTGWSISAQRRRSAAAAHRMQLYEVS